MSEDVSVEVIQKTQKLLGKYVKKPALTEKLLRKPPFRFLHDVINVVIKDTGFLKGLFSETELISDNVKDKEAKIAYLTKLIEAVKTITKTDLKVKPNKIVAGLEPSETNILLQTIAKAIDRKLDSSEYVKKIKSGHINTNNEKKKSKKTSDIVKSSTENLKIEKASSKHDSQKKKSLNETPKSTERSKSKVRSKDDNKKGKQDSTSKIKNNTEVKEKRAAEGTINQPIKTNKVTEELNTDRKEEDINNETSNNENHNVEKRIDNSITNAVNSDNNVSDSISEHPKDEFVEAKIKETQNVATKNYVEVDSSTEPTKTENEDKSKDNVEEGLKVERRPSTSLVRPKSARPKSGELKEKTLSQLSQGENKEKRASRVLQPNDVPSHENQKDQVRPSSSLRPPSVRPPSARAGAPRLRPDSAIPMDEVVAMGKINVIVESFDKDADEEETVIIQNSPDLIENHDQVIDVPLENKGHLVEQILETINESTADGKRPKIEIDWEKDALRGKDAAAKEIKELRSLIQTLTRTANPLGKLLNYLHEDVEAMHNELEMWTTTKRQLLMEIAKQQRISEEANQPLLNQLETLKQDIKKQEQEILAVRSNILRNEIRIKELLTK